MNTEIFITITVILSMLLKVLKMQRKHLNFIGFNIFHVLGDVLKTEF